jgi:uncharacterized protein (UPF0276 family)
MPDNYKQLRNFDAKFGIGLRNCHLKAILSEKPKIDFLEIHPENYFGFGIELKLLEEISHSYPISFHCVGLSLGSSLSVSTEHIEKIRELAERINPISISDHISWSASGNAHMPDLLPLPYNKETLEQVTNNIDFVQETLGRTIAVENPSTYLAFDGEMLETEFINQVCSISGCGLLLDINNVFVNSHNHKFDAYSYLDAIKPEFVRQYHLSGHSKRLVGSEELCIDTHDNFVIPEVWQMYSYCIHTIGTPMTLIEWDKNIPNLDILLGEAYKAKSYCKRLQHAA